MTAPPEPRHLPNGKPISTLGFGCASIWARPHFDEALGGQILEAAIANGINHFDTGPSYGPGHGERRLGTFLTGRDPAGLVLSTKVGTNFVDGAIVRSFAPGVMQRSFEASLARLGLDHVDILYLHGPKGADLNPAVFAFFDDLKRAGRITYSGVNSFDPAVLDRVAASPIDAVMLQYSVGDLRLAGQLDRLGESGKILISATALARASFSPANFLPSDRIRLWYLLRQLRHDPGAFLRGRRLAGRLTSTGKSADAAAIQFVVGHPKILSSVFGTSSVAHMISNARAARGRLTDAQWMHLATAGAGTKTGGRGY